MNIILVHGAWHSAKCWDEVLLDLSKLGNVVPINLPGRVFEKTRQYRTISMADYVRAIEGVALSLKGPIALVGHSLAGLAISQVAQNHPTLIQLLIFVTAFIPNTNECMFDITSKIKTPGIATELTSVAKENKIDIARSKRTRNLFYNLCSNEQQEKALDQLNPEPLKAFTTPITLSNDRFGQVDKIYLKCLQDKALLPCDQDRMIAKTNIKKTIAIQADHSPFLSAPNAFLYAIDNALSL